MRRVLARVAILASVTPVEGLILLGAGRIEGMEWTVAVPMTYTAGDRGVYIEIDALLPETPWADALVGKNRIIKTKKIRGVLSQGLFVPFSALLTTYPTLADTPLGTDVTALLGITKCPETPKATTSAPSSAVTYAQALGEDAPPKTDELRVQSYKHFLSHIVGNPYVITLKYDGTSATYGYRPTGFVATSRNFLAAADSVYYTVAATYGLEATLAVHPHYVVQGEIYGPKINGNALEVPDVRLAVFNVWDRRTKTYLDELTMRQWCSAQSPVLPTVEVLEQGDAFPAGYTAQTLVEKAGGVYPPPSTKPREGIVVRPIRPMFTEKGERVSVKAINNASL